MSNILGYTKSGKTIFNTCDHSSHKVFDAIEHHEAGRLHRDHEIYNDGKAANESDKKKLNAFIDKKLFHKIEASKHHDIGYTLELKEMKKK